MQKIDKDKIFDALFKKAVGYDYEETTEEFSLDDNNNLFSNKKKINKKHSPPDIASVKALFEYCVELDQNKYSQMTEEELLAEKQKLLEQLLK